MISPERMSAVVAMLIFFFYEGAKVKENFELLSIGYQVSGIGCRVSDIRYRVSGVGCRVWVWVWVLRAKDKKFIIF